MKIVINKCYGGFGLSRKALHELRKMGNEYALAEIDIGEYWPNSKMKRSKNLENFCSEIPRNDEQLISVVEKLGEKANSRFARLRIVNIPDGIDWEIDDYDG